MFGLKAVDLEKEFAAAQNIARRLESDRYTRILVCVLTGGVIAWSGLYTIAIVWVSCVLLNEAVEPWIAQRLLHSSSFSSSSMLLYMAQIMAGSAIWAGAGVALWTTHDPAVMTLGAVLLLGTLIHVTMIYPMSRLLVSAVSAPLIFAIVVVAFLVLGDDHFAMRDKTLVIFSVLILLGYLVVVIFTNIEIQDEMAKLATKNAQQARQDPLTDLSNRRHFVETVQNLLGEDSDLTLAFIDLDRFKPLNDEFGHAVGDEALKEISARLKKSEQVKFAARLGGDEFGALLDSNGDAEQLKDCLNTLWKDITESIETGIGPVDLGASIGCVQSGDSFDSHSKLMHAADIAMIRAKTSGGGVAVFDPSIDSGMLRFAEIEGAFRMAVRKGDIKAALQPIKRLETQTLNTFELLARWQRSDGEQSLTADEFIPVAERLGLLNDILWGTLEQVLPHIQGTDFRLAINISPSQLLSAQFFTKLKSVLDSYNVPPQQLELEITEQVALRNDRENMSLLQSASDVGFSIVLDDFGTGYSSISLLDQLPLSKVKLDHSFVHSAMQSAQGKTLLAAIISLLKEMNLCCCVEGVSDPEIEQYVASLGCEEVQGFLIGKPQIVGPDFRWPI